MTDQPSVPEAFSGKWAFYDDKGEIHLVGGMSNKDAALNAEAYGLQYVFGDADQALHYVVDGVIVSKKEMPASLSGVVLKGIPKDAVLNIEGSHYKVDGTNIELSFSHPGTYTVTAELFPYKTYSVQVTV